MSALHAHVASYAQAHGLPITAAAVAEIDRLLAAARADRTARPRSRPPTSTGDARA